MAPFYSGIYIDQFDLSALIRPYRGTGSAAYHPSVMLGLFVYGYATGVYSRRRIEAATYESIAFRISPQTRQFLLRGLDSVRGE